MIDDFTILDEETKDFYGFFGTPEAKSHDIKRAYKIIHEVGADNFDIDYPAFEPDTEENWNHMEPYDQANDR